MNGMETYSDAGSIWSIIVLYMHSSLDVCLCA